MKHETTYELVLTALFTAIIVIMAFTPLGYIPLIVINATIIHIPVILGALFLGPKKGAFLGFAFGFTSLINNTFKAATASAFVFSPVLAANIAGISGIFKSLFICFVPRILVGVIPYFVYLSVRDLLKKARKKAAPAGIALACAGMAGSFTNTLLVMGGIFLLYKDAYAQALGIAGDQLINVIMGIISFNGLIEAAVAGILTAGVGLALVQVKPVKETKRLPLPRKTVV